MVGKALVKDCASNWQRDATKSFDFGDSLPPNFYNKPVLWKCKQQYRDDILGISNKCPINSLIELKHGKYAGFIHTIYADKFFAHYWTPYQLVIYKHLRKTYCRLCVDATGGVVKKLLRTKHGILSSHIFLYEGVVCTDTYQVSITQMISEKQDTLTIFYWLSQWLKDGVSPPHETVCDFSKALLGAIVRAFCNNFTSLRQYNDECFNILSNKSSSCPTCYIRVDIAHLIKLVCRWKCWNKSSNMRLKEFYVRCIRLLVETNCLKDFQHVLVNILTVCSCETEGNIINTEQECPSEIAKNRLIKRIKGNTSIKDFIIVENESIDLTYTEDYDNDNDNTFDNPSISIIQQFLNELKLIVDGNILIEGERISPYYLPDFRENLLRICKDFPLWTNVMRTIFNSPYSTAISAPVEGNFAELKNSILKHESKPMTVDRFIVTHIESIDASMIIARSHKIVEDNNNIY